MSKDKAASKDVLPEEYHGKPITKRREILSQMKRTKAGYVMVAPFLILFFAFTILPVILSILLSFTSFNMLEFPEFKGFANYVNMFLADDLFITAVTNTLLFAIATGPTSLILSFLVAWFINELSPRIRAIVTILFYAPSLVANSAITIFSFIFQGDIYGVVNGILMKLGLINEAIAFFKDVDYIVPLCIFVSLWSSLGSSFLASIAGLQGVDRALYEAGAIDGIKNRWQEAWYVTLPSMKPMLKYGAVMSITSAFNFGPMVTLLCGTPSTDYVAWTLQHHLTEYMTVRFEYGYASAIAVVLFAMMIGTNWAISKLISRMGQ